MNLSTKNILPEINFLFLSIIAIILVLVLFPIKIFSGYFIFLIFFVVAIFLLNNKLGFFLLLLIRPLLDSLTNFNILSLSDFSFNLSAILGIIATMLTILVYIKNRKDIPKTSLKLFWWFFIVVTFLSIFFSFNKVISFIEWVRLLSIYSFFFLGFLLIKNKYDFFQLLKVTVYSALIPTFFAIYQFITETGITLPLEGITNRIYGTFAHPNLFAYYLVLVISILTYLILVRKNLFSNSLLFIFYSIVLVLTFTRGAWLALILIFFIIGIIKYRKMLLALILILLFVYIAIEPIRIRVNALNKYDPNSSIEWRKGIWQDGLSIAKEKIFLGHGTGTASKILLENRGEKAGSPDPHNDYLKIFIENGLIGVLSYILLILALWYNLIKKYFSSQDSDQKDLYLILFGLSVAIFTMSFADNVIRNTVLQWTFWAMLGGALTTYKK